MFTIVFLFLRTPFEDRSGFVFIVTENRFYAHETGETQAGHFGRHLAVAMDLCHFRVLEILLCDDFGDLGPPY